MKAVTLQSASVSHGVGATRGDDIVPQSASEVSDENGIRIAFAIWAVKKYPISFCQATI